MKKLTLRKKVITVLSDNEMQSVNGGGTTSYTNCTGFLCCSPECHGTSEGPQSTCLVSTCPTPPPTPV